eukprot:6111690-Pyramimonas_sp.AAC.1
MPKKTPDTNVKVWFLANYAAHVMEQWTSRPPVMITVSQTVIRIPGDLLREAVVQQPVRSDDQHIPGLHSHLEVVCVRRRAARQAVVSAAQLEGVVEHVLQGGGGLHHLAAAHQK